jgi:hypothetical protein
MLARGVMLGDDVPTDKATAIDSDKLDKRRGF